MKPENVHLISFCWLLVPLVVYWGVQWSLMVQDGGRDMTQSWAVCGKEVREMCLAFVQCQVGRPSSLSDPGVSLAALQNRTLWQHEGSSHCLCSESLAGNAVSARKVFVGGTGNLEPGYSEAFPS